MSDSTIEPDRWEKIQEIFHDALALEQPARKAFLDSECGDDARLRSEVESLLAAHESEGLVGYEQDEEDRLPESVGPYRVISRIGEGGMGVVYLAERQVEDFTQRVAVKVMRAGGLDPFIERRIRAERKILARLEHPGIARLIDGGTDRGAPYLVMEYVEGSDILTYCDRDLLSVDERLRLFLEVCDAVKYAHQQLVIHRDLKPSNILVTPDGRPRLLDFGIARLSDPELAEGSAHTAAWFTPAYASPEQVRGEHSGVLTDVYALGVILYELISGHRPYVLDGASPAQMREIICEVEPASPSRALNRPASFTDHDGALVVRSPEFLAERRSESLERLHRRLRGDLDVIALKALAKEPERRYRSVDDLADDLRRHMTGQPVRARADTLGYRFTKFVSRHRVAVTLGLVAAVSLIGGSAAAVWQAQRAVDEARTALAERDRAEREATKAARVTNLMVDLFQLSDPSQALGDTITASEILDRGTARVQAEFGDQPQLQADLFREVGRIYSNMGLLYRAESLTQRSLSIADSLPDADSASLMLSNYQLGAILGRLSRPAAAEPYLRRALALADSDSMRAAIASDLAWELRELRQYDEAASLFREALEIQQQIPGADADVANSILGLASVYHDEGRFDDAEQLFLSFTGDFTAGRERPNPLAAEALVTAGMIRRLRENFQGAEPLLRAAMEIHSTLYEPDHPARLNATYQWGALLINLGRYREAETVLRPAMVRAVPALGNTHSTTGNLREGLAMALEELGRFGEANTLYERSLAAKSEVLEPDHPNLVASLINASAPLISAGRLDEAERLLDRAGSTLSEPGGVFTMRALHQRGRLELARGNLAASDSLFAAAAEIGAEKLREGHRYRVANSLDHARMWLERGEPAAALEELRITLPQVAELRPSPHPHIGRALLLMARAHLAMGEPEAAAPLLERAEVQLTELPQAHPLRIEFREVAEAVATITGSDLPRR